MSSDTGDKKKDETQKRFWKDALSLIVCAGGIYVSYLIYGLLHEKIYKHEYGENKEKFTHSLFLVGFQCIFNMMFAAGVLLIKNKEVNRVPHMSYLKIATSYMGAMFASNYAISFVSYPTQVLGKSCKLIPVMLMRIIVLKKRYKLREYLTVAMITVGICVFTLFKESSKKGSTESSWAGLGLLFLSLALDGYTGPTQERIFSVYSPTVTMLMFWINFWAIAIVVTALTLTGQLMPAIAFIMRYPEMMQDIFLFSLMSAIGQNFILQTLERFNSLVLTIVTTTRKFFTIMASLMWYGHVLNNSQWIGVGLVFGGLSLNIYEKYQKAQAAHSSA